MNDGRVPACGARGKSGFAWRAPKFDRGGEKSGVMSIAIDCAGNARSLEDIRPALQQVEPVITIARIGWFVFTGAA